MQTAYDICAMKRLGLACAVTALALFMYVDACCDPAGSVAGVVKDLTTDEPLAWVNVILVGTQLGAATDEVGEYAIYGVPTGTYKVKISMMENLPLF